MAEFTKLHKFLLSVCLLVMVVEIFLGVYLSVDKQCNLMGKYSVLSEYSAHLAMTSWSLMTSLDSRIVLGLSWLYLMFFHCCMFYPVLLKNVKLRNSECEPDRHEQVYQIFAVTAVVFSSLFFCLTVASLIVLCCAKKSYLIGKTKACLKKKKRQKDCLKAIDTNQAALVYTDHYKIRFPVNTYTLSSSLEKAEVAYLYRYCTVESVFESAKTPIENYSSKCSFCLRQTTSRSIILPKCRHSYHKLCLLVIIRGHKKSDCITCRSLIRPQIFARMQSMIHNF